VPGSASRGIYLSYRREDTTPYAYLVKRELNERIRSARIVMDLDATATGSDLMQAIQEAVGSCAVLVALIGPVWATLAGPDGRRQLDNPDDHVRFEVQTALERGARVIPVLVDGARPLGEQQLPAELAGLARLNAVELSYGRYQHDAGRLVDRIQQVLAAPTGTDTGARAATQALTDAERAIRSITDEYWKATALIDLARALAPIDPDHAARLITDAARIAQPMTNEHSKDMVLADMAETLAGTDPDRAERIAQTITDDRKKAEALGRTAVALAARAGRLTADAERIARSIPGESSKAEALAGLVSALAPTDPGRAERIAQSITDDRKKTEALAKLAKALAPTEPDRAAQLIADAESVARSIPDEEWAKFQLKQHSDKDRALWSIAWTLAEAGPRLMAEPERIARSITDESSRAEALACIANVLAATEPDRAVRLIAEAERVARSITEKSSTATTLAFIVSALAATSPGRAVRLTADAERIARSITDEFEQARALADVVRALAATDPARAERVARSITRESWKGRALADVVRALAATDPARAERIAQSITDPVWRTRALVMIVAEAGAMRSRPLRIGG
jgi:hypothetical protein